MFNIIEASQIVNYSRVNNSSGVSDKCKTQSLVIRLTRNKKRSTSVSTLRQTAKLSLTCAELWLVTSQAEMTVRPALAATEQYMAGAKACEKQWRSLSPSAINVLTNTYTHVL